MIRTPIEFFNYDPHSVTLLTPSLLARLENAVRHETRGELEVALERYRSVLDEDPENSEALSLLGKLEYRLGDYGAAVFHLQRAARLAPDRADVHLGLGYALSSVGEQRQAVRAFLDALEADANYAPALVSLGCVFAQHAQHELARRAFDFARQAGSVYPEVHYQLGKYYAGAGHDEPALAALLNAQRLGGRFNDIHALLAQLYFKQGAYEKCLVQSQCHHDQHPLDAQAYVVKSAALFELGRYTAALNACQSALQHAPRNVDALVLLGRIHFSRGDLQGATRSFQAAIKMTPDAPAAHAGMSEVYAQRGEVHEALEHIRQAGDPKGYDLNTALLCARLLFTREQYSEAIGLLNYRLQARLDHVAGRRRCHFMLAELYEAQLDFGRAFRHFTLANELRRPQQQAPAEHASVSLDFFSSTQMARLRRCKLPLPPLVFVVGLPGFALRFVKQLLSSHSDLAISTQKLSLKALAESVPSVLATPMSFPYALSEARAAELAVLATQYRTQNFPSNRFALIDSQNDVSPYLGFASLLFQNLRVVQLNQKPADLALDIFTEDSQASCTHLATDLSSTKIRLQQLQDTMAHWSELGEFPILQVSFEQLVAQPEPTLAKLLAFIGVESQAAVFDCLHKPGTDGNMLTKARSRVSRSERFAPFLSEHY